ncbi:unnamed protein product [Macrosiphum euphorbiae]|uniref:TTF-type domain-containing protein n=1 Tax=Macrosiphum euphorbiae TaxID=13131 RepID=A0AAV0WRI1_9HEMI|nr:unnamed protein product [Macrosiphum euphorbiae]
MYKYPILEHNKKRGLRFQAKWFDEFPWLVYSEIKSGAFCQKCVIFSKTGGALKQPLGQLVLREFNNWKKLEVFQDHCKLTYYINATLDAEHFLNILEKREKSIIEQIDNYRRLQIKENRRHLIPIVECIIMCSRQELTLRGHRGETNKTLSVNDVNESKCFSILADETTDISSSEQLTLCLRYIDEDGNLNEDFLKFIEVENLTGT